MMHSNREHFMRLVSRKPELMACYVISSVFAPVYWGENNKWVDEPRHAISFEFASIACAYAIVRLKLDIEHFTIERVHL